MDGLFGGESLAVCFIVINLKMHSLITPHTQRVLARWLGFLSVVCSASVAKSGERQSCVLCSNYCEARSGQPDLHSTFNVIVQSSSPCTPDKGSSIGSVGLGAFGAGFAASAV